MTGADTSLPLAGIVLLEERSVYGEMKLYPANALAKQLAAIADTKTVTPNMVRQFKALGLTVQTTGVDPRQL